MDGSTAKLLIKSVQRKIPRKVNKFLSSNDSKSRLIGLTFHYIKTYPIKCLTILKCDTIILSGNTSCEIVNHHECRPTFHSFTCNDYVSAFFRKGKSVCWEMMIKNDLFVEIITQLGDDWELSQQIKLVLEKYVCRLYGSKKDTVRFDMFERKQKKGVMVDLSNLPPSQSALYLHMERANYVARLWKLAGVPMLNPPSPIGSGWDEDGDIQWIENMLPDEVSSIFLKTDDSDSEEDNCDSEDEYYGEEETESEDSDYYED